MKLRSVIAKCFAPAAAIFAVAVARLDHAQSPWVVRDGPAGGNDTFQLSSKGNANGVALIEIYEVGLAP